MSTQQKIYYGISVYFVFLHSRSVEEGEELLRVLQLALRDIASTQLEIDRVAALDQVKVVSDNFALQWERELNTFELQPGMQLWSPSSTMSESGQNSEVSTDYDDSCEDSSADTEFTDNLHSSEEDEGSYTDEDGEEEEDDGGLEPQPSALRRRRHGTEDLIRRKPRVPDEDPPEYAPDRWPPLIDFIFVFSSFIAAVVAAYFTIF